VECRVACTPRLIDLGVMERMLQGRKICESGSCGVGEGDDAAAMYCVVKSCLDTVALEH
jgi:hypothetical protein